MTIRIGIEPPEQRLGGEKPLIGRLGEEPGMARRSPLAPAVSRLAKGTSRRRAGHASAFAMQGSPLIVSAR